MKDRFWIPILSAVAAMTETTNPKQILKLATGLLLVFVLGVAIPTNSFACHKGTPHGKDTDCTPPPGGEDPVVYTAELTAGAFVFADVAGSPIVMTVAPNSRENSLQSGDDFYMGRLSGLESAWNTVFDACGELLAPGSIQQFFELSDNWRIDRAGGNDIRIRIQDIPLTGKEGQSVEVEVQLVGHPLDINPPNTDPFLPQPGNVSDFILDYFVIWGGELSGGQGGKTHCQPRGSGTAEEQALGTSSTLTIRAQ